MPHVTILQLLNKAPDSLFGFNELRGIIFYPYH